uniref:Chromo domain-containing protein n=1 Tax=Magallana gigas TaxID=29159 RepID=A0A8W8JJP2_MAGGI
MSRRPYSSDHNADDNTKDDRPEVQVSVVDKSLPLSDDTYQTVFTYEENPSVHLVDAEPQPSLPDFCEIGQLQRVGESKMQHLIKYLETQELPDDEKLAKTILYMENYFVLENNVLYHFYEPRTKGNNTYGLRKCSDNKLLKASIHANRLKAYHDPQDRRLQPVEDQNLDAGKNDNERAEQDNQLQNQTGKPLAPNNTVTDFPHTAENANMQQTAAPSNPSNDWFPIKKIVKSRYVQGKRQYLVDWEGKYAKSWLQEEDLGPGLIREYHATRTMADLKVQNAVVYFLHHPCGFSGFTCGKFQQD